MLYSFYPKCINTISSFALLISSQQLKIQCQCGYKGKLPLLSFVENYNNLNNSSITFICPTHNHFTIIVQCIIAITAQNARIDNNDWFIIDLTAIDLSEIEITVKQAEQF